MNDNDKKHGKPDGKIDNLEVKDIDSYIGYLIKLLGNLQSKINQLPKVDEKGRSECPVAEDLFFKKEEAQKSVVEELKKGPKYLTLLNNEIAKFRQNSRTIIADATHLNSKEAKKNYHSAREAQQFQINKNIKKREELRKIISEAYGLLKMAHGKKWPLGKPKERMNFPMFPLGKSVGGAGAALDQGRLTRPLPHSPQIKADIGNLIDIGPIPPPPKFKG